MRNQTLVLAILAVACVVCCGGQPVQKADGKTAEIDGLKGGEEPRKFTFNLEGTEKLTLIATGYSWGQAVWGEPRLIAADGSQKKLVELKPDSATVGWDTFRVNQGPDAKPLKVGSRELADGFFAHADSQLIFKLDRKYVRFEALVGINCTAGKQGKVKMMAGDAGVAELTARVAAARTSFTPEALAGARQAIENALKLRAGTEAGATAEKLRKALDRVGAYEASFAELKAKLETTPREALDKVEEIQAFLRETLQGVLAGQIDAPLLFVKRHDYHSAHIYDEYLTWHPGGGIYVIENPSAPQEQQTVRTVIDAKSKETLGEGVYSDPDISYDAKRVLFSFKGRSNGDTSIYEIGIDGSGLRRVTHPGDDCSKKTRPAGLIGDGQHDVKPCYLPDERIAFTSTRSGAQVMCFSSYIDILHTCNADGSDLKCISVNNQNEFDPCVMPDGRILYGRWEYVDKTALYMQSLWTINPDGTGERAVFKNNLAKPTAVLDARPVPGTDLIVAALTPHNGQSVGAIAMIDPKLGKNNLGAITNFTPEYPKEMDQGLSRGPCDPWPLSADAVLIANNAEKHGKFGVIELITRQGARLVIHKEPDISCYAPMLVKPRAREPIIPAHVQPGATTGRFLVQNVYEGMPGVKTGDVKWLRVLETTARISGLPPGGRWWNQAFLVSWQGSYDIKWVLGVVPVAEDGSAYFEAPAAKALYFQALDKDHRLMQSMRTFVQAAPGVTRSCLGCHVNEENVSPPSGRTPVALKSEPDKIAPENWGTGFVDYPTMIQPILDKHCVSCHGGEKGIEAGIDLSGGWTWAFNISYETLIKNTLTGFLNCENGSVHTAEILPPRKHGSGSAPLAQLLVSGHNGYIKELSEKERNLLLVWMDGNCNYYGKWDYSPHATCNEITVVRNNLLPEMEKAGCTKCHQKEIGNDWVNLKDPEQSRMLRAPLAVGRASLPANGGGRAGTEARPTGLGLAWCRDGKAPNVEQVLVTNGKQPPDVFRPKRSQPPPKDGAPTAIFNDTSDASYKALLEIIRNGREAALQKPRVDMPGAQITPGFCRELTPVTPPKAAGQQTMAPGGKERAER
ncbi:MAG TPA: NPCBM/NEW2 domain-containing protein [Planctomycetota bacterium]|jgi:hypothetical protein